LRNFYGALLDGTEILMEVRIAWLIAKVTKDRSLLEKWGDFDGLDAALSTMFPQEAHLGKETGAGHDIS
jgi:hypothetical protein